MTSQHYITRQVQHDFRRAGGIELILQVLHTYSDWPIVKASSGLIRNLCNNEDNHEIMVNLGVIPRMGQVLAMAVKEDKNVSQIQSCFDGAIT